MRYFMTGWNIEFSKLYSYIDVEITTCILLLVNKTLFLKWIWQFSLKAKLYSHRPELNIQNRLSENYHFLCHFTVYFQAYQNIVQNSVPERLCPMLAKDHWNTHGYKTRKYISFTTTLETREIFEANLLAPCEFLRRNFEEFKPYSRDVFPPWSVVIATTF